MAARTLDAIVMETLGLKEMTIARLLWQIDDLKAQLELRPPAPPSDGTEQARNV